MDTRRLCFCPSDSLGSVAAFQPPLSALVHFCFRQRPDMKHQWKLLLCMFVLDHHQAIPQRAKPFERVLEYLFITLRLTSWWLLLLLLLLSRRFTYVLIFEFVPAVNYGESRCHGFKTAEQDVGFSYIINHKRMTAHSALCFISSPLILHSSLSWAVHPFFLWVWLRCILPRGKP